jgi:hypothetical protein
MTLMVVVIVKDILYPIKLWFKSIPELIFKEYLLTTVLKDENKSWQINMEV